MLNKALGDCPRIESALGFLFSDSLLATGLFKDGELSIARFAKLANMALAEFIAHVSLPIELPDAGKIVWWHRSVVYVATILLT